MQLDHQTLGFRQSPSGNTLLRRLVPTLIETQVEHTVANKHRKPRPSEALRITQMPNLRVEAMRGGSMKLGDILIDMNRICHSVIEI